MGFRGLSKTTRKIEEKTSPKKLEIWSAFVFDGNYYVQGESISMRYQDIS